jgi:hypothetical protein
MSLQGGYDDKPDSDGTRRDVLHDIFNNRAGRRRAAGGRAKLLQNVQQGQGMRQFLHQRKSHVP